MTQDINDFCLRNRREQFERDTKLKEQKKQQKQEEEQHLLNSSKDNSAKHNEENSNSSTSSISVEDLSNTSSNNESSSSSSSIVNTSNEEDLDLISKDDELLKRILTRATISNSNDSFDDTNHNNHYNHKRLLSPIKPSDSAIMLNYFSNNRAKSNRVVKNLEYLDDELNPNEQSLDPNSGSAILVDPLDKILNQIMKLMLEKVEEMNSLENNANKMLESSIIVDKDEPSPPQQLMNSCKFDLESTTKGDEDEMEGEQEAADGEDSDIEVLNSGSPKNAQNINSTFNAPSKIDTNNKNENSDDNFDMLFVEEETEKVKNTPEKIHANAEKIASSTTTQNNETILDTLDLGSSPPTDLMFVTASGGDFAKPFFASKLTNSQLSEEISQEIGL